MPGGTSHRIYSPMMQDDVIGLLRDGFIPAPFVRRMRLINLITATTLQKLEQDLLTPWTVLNISQALNQQASQDYIITTIRNEALQYALWHGNVRPLWNISAGYPKLRKSFYTGWIHRFFWVPFDPLCIMLSMRTKALLDLFDEMEHSYNLMKDLGFGFIDLGEIPDETPGDPGHYYWPEIENPIDYPDPPLDPVPDPGPDEPGYFSPDPSPMPGEPGYIRPLLGEPGYVEPVPIPGDRDFLDPAFGEPDYFRPWPGSGGRFGSFFSPYNLSLDLLNLAHVRHPGYYMPVSKPWFYSSFNTTFSDQWTDLSQGGGIASIVISRLNLDAQVANSQAQISRDDPRAWPTDWDWSFTYNFIVGINSTWIYIFTGSHYVQVDFLPPDQIYFYNRDWTVDYFNIGNYLNIDLNFTLFVRNGDADIYLGDTLIKALHEFPKSSSTPGRMAIFAHGGSLVQVDEYKIFDV